MLDTYFDFTLVVQRREEVASPFLCQKMVLTCVYAFCFVVFIF